MDNNNYLNNQIHVTTNNSSYGVVSQQSTYVNADVVKLE
jgi:hypothetical protein